MIKELADYTDIFNERAGDFVPSEAQQRIDAEQRARSFNEQKADMFDAERVPSACRHDYIWDIQTDGVKCRVCAHRKRGFDEL